MKIEYGDLYKFLVSVGVALVSLAILTPWLFFREQFDLLLTQEELDKLTPLGKVIIEYRQNLVFVFIQVIPYLSAFLAIFGLGLMIAGIRLWWIRSQKSLDEQQQISTEILRQQLRKATQEEVAAKSIEEATEELAQQPSLIQEQQGEVSKSETSPYDEINKVAHKALAIEATLVEQLNKCFEKDFDVLSEQRFSDFIIDAVLLPKDPFRKSYTIEIKYTTRRLSYNWLRENALRISNKNRLYQLDVNQIPIPVLIVVAPAIVLSEIDEEEYRRRIGNESIFRKGKWRLIFLAEESLETSLCTQLREFIY